MFTTLFRNIAHVIFFFTKINCRKIFHTAASSNITHTYYNLRIMEIVEEQGMLKEQNTSVFTGVPLSNPVISKNFN